MTKPVNLPELIYEDIASISNDLTSLAKKPFSPAMTISLLIEVYRAYTSEPCARDAFRQRIATSNFMSPEDFEKEWDTHTQKQKKQKKNIARQYSRQYSTKKTNIAQKNTRS
jgi:hypothetical protein